MLNSELHLKTAAAATIRTSPLELECISALSIVKIAKKSVQPIFNLSTKSANSVGDSISSATTATATITATATAAASTASTTTTTPIATATRKGKRKRSFGQRSIRYV